MSTNPFFAHSADAAPPARYGSFRGRDELAGLDLSTPTATSTAGQTGPARSMFAAPPSAPMPWTPETSYGAATPASVHNPFMASSAPEVPVWSSTSAAGGSAYATSPAQASAAHPMMSTYGPSLFSTESVAGGDVYRTMSTQGSAAAPVPSTYTTAAFPTTSTYATTTFSMPTQAPTSTAPAQSAAEIEADALIARTLAQEGSADEVQWSLKDVAWQGTTTKVIMQNENGPCSLIALCNVLLLQHKLDITPADRPAVSYSYLSSRLAEFLVTHNAGVDAPTLSSALRVLPSMQSGMDVDVGFHGPTHFVTDAASQQYADQLTLFRLAGVPLVHGWLPDAADEPTYAAVTRAGSYNAATMAVAQGDAYTHGGVIATSTNPFAAETAHGNSDASLVHRFLQTHASQLTPAGIAQLRATLHEGQLAVLFRNAHLSVLYKRRRNEGAPGSPDLFTLVTDDGFLLEDKIVWESLQDPQGEYNAYFDAHFVHVPYSRPARDTHAGTADSDPDYALAVQLQNQERDRALAVRRARRNRAPGTHDSSYASPEQTALEPTRTNPLHKMGAKLRRKPAGGASSAKRDCVIM